MGYVLIGLQTGAPNSLANSLTTCEDASVDAAVPITQLHVGEQRQNSLSLLDNLEQTGIFLHKSIRLYPNVLIKDLVIHVSPHPYILESHATPQIGEGYPITAGLMGFQSKNACKWPTNMAPADGRSPYRIRHLLLGPKAWPDRLLSMI